MSPSSSQIELIGPDADLAQRCGALGITLLEVDLNGAVCRTYLRPDRPLEAVVVGSPMFRLGLAGEARRWATQDTPRVAQLWSGCYILPLARTQRRRRFAYYVAVVITPELAAAEQFHALCDSARLDRVTAAQRLAKQPAASPQELGRSATLLAWMTQDIERIAQQDSEIDLLSQQLGETYEELNLVYKLSAHMTVTQDSRTFLQDALAELHQVVGLKWTVLQLGDTDVRLEALQGQSIICSDEPHDEAAFRKIGLELLERHGHAGPAIIENARSMGIEALAAIADRMLIVPILVEGRPLAVLFGADKLDGSELSSVDSKLVTSTAQNIGIFLENAMLYEDMQDMFMGTLHALVSSIDAKDSYTCGHSERVAWLSRQLAEAAGLDPYTVERVYLSGLIHDVGKIGVPEAVLCKPGKLTNEEFDMIKTHPEIGVRILKDIRQMQDLLPGVLHHHERWDGRGYPYKLAGQDIPLFGRLICLADSFDAMSSTRTYRNALPLEKVLQEIERCAGAQFDPELAKVFVKLDFEPFKRMVEEHQQRRSPLHQAMRSVS
ncbi:MAG: HD domain-containing protein [Planctomycetes bacterium]|nr:HD domain-containing protein [Planctomycetota bacterium]